MACCSPPPSFSIPHRQGSQQPIRCAGGGFLQVISDEERYAKGIYYANLRRGSIFGDRQQGKNRTMTSATRFSQVFCATSGTGSRRCLCMAELEAKKKIKKTKKKNPCVSTLAWLQREMSDWRVDAILLSFSVKSERRLSVVERGTFGYA